MATMLETLRVLAARGVVEDIAVAFAEFIGRLDGRGDPGIVLAACWISHSTAQGNICVDLREKAGQMLFDDGDLAVTAPPLAQWSQTLRESAAVGAPGAARPLILDDSQRLYLYRYWDYERRLAENVLERAQENIEGVTLPALRAALDEFFGVAADHTVDWQRLAAAVAVLKRFCIIAGGPGTGKTTTVVRLLAVLKRLYGKQPLRVALTAPTGKAAARVAEAIRAAKAQLERQGAAAVVDIPEEAATLHRLLGVNPDTGQFRYHARNPLPADVVIVDEASMVDLALMAKLADALAPSARLILVGDRDQLASVEAGSVLADLCTAENGFSPAFAAQLYAATGQRAPSVGTPTSCLRDNVVVLMGSRRFGDQSGIGRVARDVNHGDAPAVIAALAEAGPDVAWFREQRPSDRHAPVFARILAGYADYRRSVLDHADVADVFAAFNRFRVLCAVRLGLSGVDAMNRSIEEALWPQRLRNAALWYPGRAVMMMRNDYTTGLFNGDIGIALRTTEERSQLRVYFPSPSGYRGFHPARLPRHETVYAMTVHKSQGSEFDEVLLLLPDEESKALSRELLYTAITRARRRFELCASAKSVTAAVERRVTRASGLAARLDAGSG